MLEGLAAVQDQQGAAGRDRICQGLALVGGVGGGVYLHPEPVQDGGQEVVLGGLAVVAGALAVEGPGVDALGPAPAGGPDPVEPALDQGGLARPAGGYALADGGLARP